MHPSTAPRLDAGAGTGLAARLTGLRFVALDASAAMLRHAEGARVQGDLYRLPFADAVFGTVICVTALIGFSDPRPAIDELMRVVRPGGQLGVSVLAHERLDQLWAALVAHGQPRRLELTPDVGFVLRRSPPQSVHQTP
jgi:SAM-dependent methyltransferase